MQNNTFFGDLLSRHTIVLHETTSTNDYLLQLLSNFTPLPEYTAIMANMQTEGRGQRGTVWHTLPFQNLTTSIYLKPKNLAVSNQFFLTVVASLAVRDTVAQFSDIPVHIKWPNDIYVDRRKICGILIENKLAGSRVRASVLGIGLNVLQTEFPAELQNRAISLRQLAPTAKLSFMEIVHHLQRFVAHYASLLEQGEHAALLSRYNEHLFQKDETRPYIVDDQLIHGEIVGVAGDGLLQISQQGKLQKYDLKGLVYQL